MLASVQGMAGSSIAAHDSRRSTYRILITLALRHVLWLLPFVILASLWQPKHAHADNGQCVWEGGQGAPTYPSCVIEDCMGAGGKAKCSDPEIRPAFGHTDAQADSQKFNYLFGAGGNLTAQTWCLLAGGTYDGYDGQLCFGPFLAGLTYVDDANSEGLAIQMSDAYINTFAGNGCVPSLISDSGWGAVSGGWGYDNPPAIVDGAVVWSQRNRLYSTCNGSTQGVSLLETRSVACPITSITRTTAGGQMQCVILASCAELGGAVCPVTGGELRKEMDYSGPGEGALELAHYYNSAARFQLFSGQPFIAQPSTYWQFSYQRHLLPINTSAIAGIVQREDGTFEEFDSSGQQVLNINGGADHLVSTSSGWTLTRGDGSAETYNSAGLLTAVATISGRTTTVSYGANGQISQVADNFGHTLQYYYNANGQLTSVTLPDGTSTVTYTYNSLGMLASVLYADQTSRSYSYQDANNSYLLSSITDESGAQYAAFQYASNGAMSSESQGGIQLFQYGIGNAGSPTNDLYVPITDALGTMRYYVFGNPAGVYTLLNVSSYCPTCPDLASASFDANGNYQTKTGYNGNQTTYVFDQTRNLELSRTEGLQSGGVTGVTRTIATTWHPTFRLPTSVSVYPGPTATGTPSKTTSTSYDSYGNVLTSSVTDGATNVSRTTSNAYLNNGLYGQVQTSTGPRTDVNQSTSYTYYACASGGACGHVQTVTDALGHTTTYGSYDANGLPLSISDPNGVVTTLTYDVRQRLTSRTVAGEQTSFSYYSTGLLKRTTLPDGSYSQYVYDAAHRLTEIDDSLGNRDVYTLDAAGNIQVDQRFDPTGTLQRKHTRLYNAAGELWQKVTAAATQAQATVYGYDLSGNRTSVNAPLSRNTMTSYDSLNRAQQIVDPNQGVTLLAYDANDNLVSVIDPKQLVTTYTYNGLGDLQQTQSPDTGTTQNTFDSAGNVASSTDSRGAVVTNSYDALNRLTLSVYSDQTVTYSYDQGANGVGRLSSITDASGSTRFGYDARGRVVTKTSSVAAVNLGVTYGYSNGELVSMTTPSGQNISYGYNGNNKIGNISLNGSTLLSDVTYAPMGPVTGWTWGNGTETSRTYDLDGKLSALTSAGTSTYSFYDDGNIATRNDDWGGGYDLAAGATNVSVAGTSNQVTATTGTLARNYGYDNAGRVVTVGNASTFTYNGAGRMTSADVGSGQVTFAANALGQRLSKTSPSGTTLFAFDESGHLIGEYTSSGSLIEETIWFGDIPVATVQPASGGGVTVFYIHADHLNTPRRISRPADNVVVWRWDSDPFGVAVPNEDPDGDGNLFVYNLRFPGQYFDVETGLVYNMARDYDSPTGRYLESDPIGLMGGTSTYAYASGSPIGNSDAAGLQSSTATPVPVPIYFPPVVFPWTQEHRAWMTAANGAINDLSDLLGKLCRKNDEKSECLKEIEACMNTCQRARKDPNQRSVWGGNWWKCLTGCVPHRCQKYIDEDLHNDPDRK
jgi:RHS repeat-associated protein